MARSEHVRRIWPFLRDRRIDALWRLTRRYRDWSAGSGPIRDERSNKPNGRAIVAAMNPLATATSKGAATRDAIIDKAYEIARFAGHRRPVDRTLAQAVGCPRAACIRPFRFARGAVAGRAGSGRHAFRRLRAGRGPVATARPARLRADAQPWFEWGAAGKRRLRAGGFGQRIRRPPARCATRVLRNERRWRQELQRAAQIAIDCGHLRDGDTDQYAFELYAIPLAMLHEAGLFGYEQARGHGDRALERWFAAHAASPLAASPIPRRGAVMSMRFIEISTTVRNYLEDCSWYG